ncbi:MAG: Cdc6/Cdc18 family protein, partial [Candidatus Baldrarchaeia archaeon]
MNRFSAIFKDETKLDISYVPRDLPNREKQLQKLRNHFSGTLKSGMSRNVLIFGDVGTGKTVTTKRFCQIISADARKQGKEIKWARVNCMDHLSPNTILSAVFGELNIGIPERGFSDEEMLESLRRYLESRSAHLILILDDVDAHFKKYGCRFIYSLTRFNEGFRIKGYEGVSLILISHENILNRFDSATISSFGHTKIEFNRYSWKELTEIIRQRVNLAFYNDRVDDESISLIADIASIWGDARFAIELLWKAGKAAESQGENVVTPEHVRAAKAETYSILTESKLKYLKKQEKILLLAIARGLRKNGKAYLKTGETMDIYKVVCEEYGETPR